MPRAAVSPLGPLTKGRVQAVGKAIFLRVGGSKNRSSSKETAINLQKQVVLKNYFHTANDGVV